MHRFDAAADGDAGTLFWAGVAVAVGALGVVVTSALYTLAPPRAALPMPNPALTDALRDMIVGQAFMVAAGTVGVVADVIFAAGALVVMVFRRPAGLRVEPLGWAWVAISNLIFVTVDGLSAGVLTQLAALDGAAATFAGLKRVFDMLFIVGTIAFGCGGLAVLWSELLAKVSVLPKPLVWIGVAVALAGLGSSLLYFANVNLAPVIGIAIAGGALIFTVYGFQLARSSRWKIES